MIMIKTYSHVLGMLVISKCKKEISKFEVGISGFEKTS